MGIPCHVSNGGTCAVAHKLEIRTERLILRSPTLADAEAICAFCDDPDISWSIVGVPTPYSPELAARWVREYGEGLDREEKYAFLICRAADGVVMGDTVLKRDQRDNRAELGYILGKNYRGQGYAYEAARAMVDFAFESLELHRLWATTFARNERSSKLLRKLGFRREGVLREHCLKWGRYEDDVLWGLLRRDWKKA